MSQVQFTIILYIYIIFCINLDDIGVKIVSDVDIIFPTSTTKDDETPNGMSDCQQSKPNNLVGKILNKTFNSY
jgi:hypothetical protein